LGAAFVPALVGVLEPVAAWAGAGAVPVVAVGPDVDEGGGDAEQVGDVGGCGVSVAVGHDMPACRWLARAGDNQRLVGVSGSAGGGVGARWPQ